MATSFILALLVLVFFLLIMRCTRAGVITLFIAILCFLGVGNGMLSALLLNHLQAPFSDIPQPLWKSKNAIVLLGAGTIKPPGRHTVNPAIMAYSRINKAASLYLSCIKNHNKCTIVITGGDATGTGRSEAIVYRDALIDLSVSGLDIELEPDSLNTYKNAELTSAILQKNKFDQVLLITSGIHLRRALLYFSHFGIHPTPVLADYIAAQITPLPLGYNFAVTDFAIHEYLGIARFHIYNFLGWNK